MGFSRVYGLIRVCWVVWRQAGSLARAGQPGRERCSGERVVGRRQTQAFCLVRRIVFSSVANIETGLGGLGTGCGTCGCQRPIFVRLPKANFARMIVLLVWVVHTVPTTTGPSGGARGSGHTSLPAVPPGLRLLVPRSQVAHSLQAWHAHQQQRLLPGRDTYSTAAEVHGKRRRGNVALGGAALTTLRRRPPP